MTKYRESLIELELDHEGKATAQLIKDLDQRMEALKRQVLWALLTDLHEMILSRIPKGRRYDKLRKSLRVSEIISAEPAFSLHIDNRSKSLRKIDLNRTVLYVRPRRSLQKPPAEVKILAERGPWTAETIPFWPGNDVAIVHQRKVDEKIVKKINKIQLKQQDKILAELAAVGKKVPKDKDKRKIPANAKAVPDLIFQMMSLEFGGGTEKATALWRKSLSELFPGRVKLLLERYDKIRRTLVDNGYRGWRSWPVVQSKIGMAEAKAGSAFQRRLGL